MVCLALMLVWKGMLTEGHPENIDTCMPPPPSKLSCSSPSVRYCPHQQIQHYPSNWHLVETPVYKTFALCIWDTIEADMILSSFSVPSLWNTARKLLTGNKEKCPSLFSDFSHGKFGESVANHMWILSPCSKEHNISLPLLFFCPCLNSQCSHMDYITEELKLCAQKMERKIHR